MLKKIPKVDVNKPLRSIRNLEYILGFNRDELFAIASHVNGFYKPYTVVENGKSRHIDRPVGKLKYLQKVINKRILSLVVLPDYVYGGRRGCSPVDNAKVHLNKNVLVRIDIRKCFPSTTDFQIFDVFKRYFGCSDKIAGLLTRLTTYRKYVPQGASTSSMLINLALLDLYKKVHELSVKSGNTFSAYVDDFGISGNNADVLVSRVVLAIQIAGYAVRNKKILIMRKGSHQEITGIVVDRVPSISKEKLARYAKILKEKASLHKVKGILSYVRSVNKVQANKLERILKK